MKNKKEILDIVCSSVDVNKFVSGDTKLMEIITDSLERLNYFLVLSEKLNIKFSIEAIINFNTLQEIVDFVFNKLESVK